MFVIVYEFMDLEKDTSVVQVIGPFDSSHEAQRAAGDLLQNELSFSAEIYLVSEPDAP